MAELDLPAANADIPAPNIVPCNFRSAGRLSNDSLRQLRTMHDSFARNVSHSLDLFLGSPLEVKLLSVEQIGSREFVSTLAAGSYLVPFTLMPTQNRAIAKFDHSLLFPLLDLLLGGSGEAVETPRELTDIDEELIRSVTDLIAVQLERTWKAAQVSVMPSPSVKPSLVGQMFLTEERIMALNFEISLARTTAGMRIVLPMPFCNVLVRSAHPEHSGVLGGATRATLPLRERLLDCDMFLTVELTGMAIPVGELISMEPGAVLNLHTSLEKPVCLNLRDHTLFEVIPVRRGGRKAAQLARPCQPQTGVIQ